MWFSFLLWILILINKFSFILIHNNPIKIALTYLICIVYVLSINRIIYKKYISIYGCLHFVNIVTKLWISIFLIYWEFFHCKVNIFLMQYFKENLMILLYWYFLDNILNTKKYFPNIGTVWQIFLMHKTLGKYCTLI